MFLWIDNDEVTQDAEVAFDPAWLDGFPVLTIQDAISEEAARG